MKKTILSCLTITVFLMIASFTTGRQHVTTSKTHEDAKLFYSCLDYWNKLKSESFDVGGQFGLVNDRTPLVQALSNLRNESDAKWDSQKITDGYANVYVHYTQSSTETFQGKGYSIVGTLSISSGPNAVQKIRFTRN